MKRVSLFEGKTINGGGMCFWKYYWHNVNDNIRKHPTPILVV